ncbi:MAG: HEAT repeat domain-containing protein [Candidatus Polarisedimenticolia bacterium]
MRRAVTLASVLLLFLSHAPSWGAQGVPREMEERFAAILALEDRRSAGDGELAGYLSPKQPIEVRERATLAAGRIGSPAVSPYLLLDVLADKAAGLRRMAAFALGEMDDVTAAPLLAVSLADTDAGVRALAAEALGKLKDPDSVPRLMQSLDDREAEVAGMTLLALWKIELGAQRGPVVEKAAGIASRASGELRRRAVYFLMRAQMGQPEDTAAREALLRHVKDRDPLLRSWVARGLGASKDDASTQALLELAGDGDWRVRVNAFNGLKARPVAAGPSRWSVYEAALSGSMPAVAVSALSSLESYEGPEADAALRAALSDARPRWREVAALVLGARAPDGAAEALEPLASDPVWSVRARAAEALALAKAPARVAAMAADNDGRVRSVALEALRRLKSAEGTAPLTAGLADQDLFVRATAMSALPFPGQSPAAAAEAAVAGYRAARDDRQNDARLAALEAMARSGGDAGRAGVEEGLKDPDYLVRRKSAELLRDTWRLDRTAQTGEPATRLSREDYLQAVRRARGRVRAAIETGSGTIRLELFPQDAPLTVDNFIRLARSGQLDGLAFHRVVPNFVIQDGDPRGDGNGGPAWQIRCEINLKRYGAGALGMALSGKDTGGSQYFITHSPQPHLDGGYTVFGEVVSGQDLVDRMIQGEPVVRVTIEEDPAGPRTPS